MCGENITAASESSLCYVPAKLLPVVPVRCCLGQPIAPFCILGTGNNSFARPGILMRLVFGDHVAVGRHCAARVCLCVNLVVSGGRSSS